MINSINSISPESDYCAFAIRILLIRFPRMIFPGNYEITNKGFFRSRKNSCRKRKTYIFVSWWLFAGFRRVDQSSLHKFLLNTPFPPLPSPSLPGTPRVTYSPQTGTARNRRAANTDNPSIPSFPLTLVIIVLQQRRVMWAGSRTSEHIN